jgi:hypothetical protein
MFRFKKVIGVAALVAVVAAMGISTVASAQGSVTPTPTAPNTQTAPPVTPPDGMGPRGLHSEAALAAAAKALGMTTDELSIELWGGKTLADIAEAQGVDIADVKAAVEAAQVEETKTAIAQAVTDGTMTQAKADWLLEGLNAGYWGPGVEGGFGMGPGMGAPGGGSGGHGGSRGGGPGGALPNSTAPSSSTTPSTTN